MSYIFTSKIVNIILTLDALALVIFAARDWRLVGFILAVILFAEVLRYLAGKPARKNLAKLENLYQKSVKRDAREGDVITVQSGERIPADGVVAEGETLCNEFPLTGSPQQILKRKGDPVYAAAINEGGDLRVSVRRGGDDTVIAKIVRSVKEMWRLAPCLEKKIAAGAILLNTLVFLSAAGVYYLSNGGWSASVTLLLAVSFDGAVFFIWQLWRANISRAALRGMVIRNAEALKRIARSSFITFNLSGQLARSAKNFSYMRAFWGAADNDILALAASAEKYSDHPLADAILAEAHRKNIKYQNPDAFTMIKGEGVLAENRGKKIIIGSEKLILENNIHIQEEIQKHISSEREQGVEVAVVAFDKKIIGVFSFSDAKRTELKMITAQLKDLGINEASAVTAAKGVIIVRDATNEADNLPAKSVDIAVNALGGGVFPEKADVLIMHNSLGILPKMITFSRESSAAMKKIFILLIGLNAIGAALIWWEIIGPYSATAFRAFSEFAAFSLAMRLYKKGE